jgi:hypothetical protein
MCVLLSSKGLSGSPVFCRNPAGAMRFTSAKRKSPAARTTPLGQTKTMTPSGSQLPDEGHGLPLQFLGCLVRQKQARATYGQFMDAMAQAMSAWSSAPSDTVTSAFKAVQDGAIQFAKESAEAGFA